MISFVLFVIGLFVGSFLGVLVDRLPKDESVLKGRSYCEKCKKKLGAFDLIPLLSFIFLSGRCRYCKAPLSFYYPVIELTTGILFVLCYIFQFFPQSGISLRETIFSLFIVSSLIVVFFTDLKYGIIPDKIIYPAIVISLLFIILNTKYLILNTSLSALGAFLFFLLLFLITRGRGMGFGDVKLVFLMGLFLGFPKIIIALYLAFLTGALVSIILVIWGKKKLKGGTVPFGPFLVLGTLISFFFGNQVLLRVLP